MMSLIKKSRPAGKNFFNLRESWEEEEEEEVGEARWKWESLKPRARNHLDWWPLIAVVVIVAVVVVIVVVVVVVDIVAVVVVVVVVAIVVAVVVVAIVPAS